MSAALCGGTADAFTKKAMQGHDVYAVAWLRQVVVVALLAPVLFFIPVPALDGVFYESILCALPFEIAAYVLYMKAIRTSPLSLTVPFLALTPVALIAISYVALGERVSPLGGVGILAIALGSYTLNLKEAGRGVLAPIRAIARERGSVMMIAVAVLYAFTNTFGKQGINHSSALFFGIVYNLAFFAVVSPVLFRLGNLHAGGRLSRGALKAVLFPGCVAAANAIFYNIAMSMAQAAYAVAVFRLSLLVGVVYGHFLFGETGFRERLAGSALMLAGFAMIVLSRRA